MKKIKGRLAAKVQRLKSLKPQKMPVLSSHLALRFYKHHGWTKEILDPYLTRGRVVDIWPGQEVRDYWFLDHTLSSRLDMERLYNERVGSVIRWYTKGEFGDQGESDLDYLKKFNW